MKIDERKITAALDRAGAKAADPAVRLFVLYGPDDSTARLLADRVGRALGPEVERIDLDGATLKADPARLADEASALSLFGGRRWVRVTGAEECFDAVEALLAVTAPIEPVVLVAPALKGNSLLQRLVLADARILAHECKKAVGAAGEALALSIARAAGLKLDARVGRMLADACAHDREVIAREADKFALYLDAAPDRPRELTPEIFELLSADAAEADAFALIDAAFDGNPAKLLEQLRVMGDGGNPIPLLRLAMRRVLTLAGTGGKGGYGNEARRPSSVRWQPDRLARVATRLFAAEAALKHQAAGTVVAHHELLSIARVAASMR